MMKIFVLIFFGIFTWSNAQTELLRNPNYKAPVFPGCDIKLDNAGLVKCFSETIKTKLGIEMQNFLEIAAYLQLDSGKATLSYALNSIGNFEDLETLDSDNPTFSDISVNMMKKLNAEIARSGELIIPATLSDKIFKQTFKTPIGYRLSDTLIPKENKEYILFNLSDKNGNVYEIRINEFHNFVVYQTNENNFKLGEFSSFTQLSELEPYHGLMIEAYKNQKVKISEGNWDSKIESKGNPIKYELWLHHFFNYFEDNSNPIAIELVPINSQKNLKSIWFSSKEELLNSPFAQYIIKN